MDGAVGARGGWVEAASEQASVGGGQAGWAEEWSLQLGSWAALGPDQPCGLAGVEGRGNPGPERTLATAHLARPAEAMAPTRRRRLISHPEEGRPSLGQLRELQAPPASTLLAATCPHPGGHRLVLGPRRALRPSGPEVGAQTCPHHSASHQWRGWSRVEDAGAKARAT